MLLKIVKIQAKTVVLLSTANIPIIQVNPNSGRRIKVPLIAVLKLR